MRQILRLFRRADHLEMKFRALRIVELCRRAASGAVDVTPSNQPAAPVGLIQIPARLDAVPFYFQRITRSQHIFFPNPPRDINGFRNNNQVYWQLPSTPSHSMLKIIIVMI